MKRRRAQPEAELQRAIVEGLRLLLGRWYLVLHVPNGGARRKTEAAILKGLGVVAGAGDILICGAGFSGWLEVKAPRRLQSPAQREFDQACQVRGIPYAVVDDVETALAIVVAAWGLAERAPGGALRCVRPTLSPSSPGASLPHSPTGLASVDDHRPASAGSESDAPSPAVAGLSSTTNNSIGDAPGEEGESLTLDELVASGRFVVIGYDHQAGRKIVAPTTIADLLMGKRHG